MKTPSQFFVFQAEDGIRDDLVTGVQTCALPIYVGPVVLAAARHRSNRIARQWFTRTKIDRGAAAVLAAVVISCKQKGIRHLPTEATRHVDELRQPDDRGPGHREALGTHDAVRLRLDDFRLAVDDESERPTHGNHGQWLKRRIQCQTSDNQSSLRRTSTL